MVLLCQFIFIIVIFKSMAIDLVSPFPECFSKILNKKINLNKLNKELLLSEYIKSRFKKTEICFDPYNNYFYCVLFDRKDKMTLNFDFLKYIEENDIKLSNLTKEEYVFLEINKMIF